MQLLIIIKFCCIIKGIKRFRTCCYWKILCIKALCPLFSCKSTKRAHSGMFKMYIINEFFVAKCFNLKTETEVLRSPKMTVTIQTYFHLVTSASLSAQHSMSDQPHEIPLWDEVIFSSWSVRNPSHFNLLTQAQKWSRFGHWAPAMGASTRMTCAKPSKTFSNELILFPQIKFQMFCFFRENFWTLMFLPVLSQAMV